MHLITDNEVYKRETEHLLAEEETITFKLPCPCIYTKLDYDWYMLSALEKIDKVKKDRHLLTSDLIIGYRMAIREAYNHDLDNAIKNRFDLPRNRNTITGIRAYIERISKASGCSNEY